MPKLSYTIQARADLRHIRRYISHRSGSRETADQFVKKLRAQCRNLAKLPGTMGAARPNLADDLRVFPYGNYIILFRYLNGFLEIVTIVERHRDIETLITPEM